MRIADILAAADQAQYTGDPATARRTVKGISTDSRSLKKGEAFLALSGEHFDGHAYIRDVARRGASLAIVDATRMQLLREHAGDMPLTGVPDTLIAYGQIARWQRRRFAYPVVAIAGSNGKTSVKELVADLLATKYTVLRTEGNLNNRIGVPAMLLRMNARYTAAVIEIGTNMPGEIETLCRILEPTHGLITNIGREHLELLGSLEGVAQEEGALFRYLAETGGTAFVNADDSRVAALARGMKGVITYGRSSRVSVRGRVTDVDTVGAPSLRIQDLRPDARAAVIEAHLRTPGLHTALNAVAAATVGLHLEVPPVALKRALESFAPLVYSSGYARLAPVRAACGAVILNDTYNANPDSVTVALHTLCAVKTLRGGRRMAVLGDMRELGRASQAEHTKVGQQIAGMKKVHLAFFCGADMKHAYQAMKKVAGADRALHFTDKQSLIGELQRRLTPKDVLLVKGSRGMAMEDVVNALRAVKDTH